MSADDELIPEVTPATGCAPPAKPGPGFLLSVGFWFLLLLVQLTVSSGVGLSVAWLRHVARDQTSDDFPADRTATSVDNLMQEFNHPAVLLATLASSVLTTCFVALIIVSLRDGRSMRRTMAFRRPHPGHVVLLVLLALPTMLVASEIGTWAQRYMPRLEGAQQAYMHIAESSWLIVVLVGALLPAFGEELFFRGLLGRGLTARYGMGLGILGTSILFGLMHLDPPQVVATALLAVPFHLVYLWGKSIWVPILAHGLNNALAFNLMRLPTDSRWRLVLGGDDHALVPPLVIIPAVICFLSLLWLFFSCRTRWVNRNGIVWSPGYMTAEMPPAELDASPQTTRPGPLPLAVTAISWVVLGAAILWEVNSHS